MKKVLQYLDFAKGYKTRISSILLVIALLVNLVWKTDFAGQELGEVFDQLISQLEVIVTSLGVCYGIIFKIIRRVQ